MKLQRAFADFNFFVKKEWHGKHVSHLKHFTKQLMHWPRIDSFPYGRYKGSDCMLMIRWLLHMVRHGVCPDAGIGRPGRSLLTNPPVDWTRPFLERIALACESSLRFFRIMHTEGLWLTRDAAASMARACYEFTQSYSDLARRCSARMFNRYHLEPCLHAFHHYYVDLQSQLDSGAQVCLSPAAANCEADEDFVGKCARMSRFVHAGTTTLRTLERYMLKIRSVWCGWEV